MALESARAIYRAWCHCCVLAVFDFIFARANPLAYDGVEHACCCGFIASRGTDIGDHEPPQGELAEGEAELETPFAATAERRSVQAVYRMSFRSFDRLTRLLAPSAFALMKRNPVVARAVWIPCLQ